MAAPPQALANVLTNHKTRVGATGGWFMIPVRRWHQDCKVFFLYRFEEICGAWEGTNIIFVSGTNVSNI
jgi:hypothetical protein